MLLVANRETVSPGWRPYKRTSVLLSLVACCLTRGNESREEGFNASMYAPGVAGEFDTVGEYDGCSKAHSHVVRSVGTAFVSIHVFEK